MNERFTSDLVFILIVLLVAALLGFLIGFFIRRIRRARFLALENENELLKIKLDESKVKLDESRVRLDETKNKLEECHQENERLLKQTFDAEAARRVFNMKIVENDLKIVEGIGEKIDSILRNNGITTWLQLSQASPEKIKDMLLTDGGPNYKIHEPKTWPAQALLAHEGKWEQLKEYQDQLTGGR